MQIKNNQRIYTFLKILSLRKLLLISLFIFSLGLSSCQLLPLIGIKVVDRVVDKAIDCAFEGCGELVNAKPEDTITKYYQLINEREYANAWSMLTSKFQRIRPDNNYNNYQEWWDSVESVEIDSMKLVNKSQDTATVDLNIKYVMKKGREWTELAQITLVMNANNIWLIDKKVKLEN